MLPKKKLTPVKSSKASQLRHEVYHYTAGIEFPAVGVSERRGKFLLVAKAGKHVVLSARNLTRQPKEELERLEALNVNLILPKAQNEFLQRAQIATSMKPTFKVATQIGWFGNVFVTPSRVYPRQALPSGALPKGWSRIQVHLDAKDEDVHSRFRCGGSPLKSHELFQLCRSNSRLMFAAALSFVGPICKPFGLRAPGFQFVGEPASGKTTVGIVAGATWGGNPDSSLGFGCSWNGTPNGLEEYAPAHHQTLMHFDETSLMPTDDKGKVMSFGEALMRLSQGQGKKRYNEPPVRWSTPLVSTSNFSVLSLLDAKRKEQYGAYVDRLIDISLPLGTASFFEDLHGFADADAFSIHLFDLATQNFGHPSRAFLSRFTDELSRDRKAIAAAVAGHVAKYKAAAKGIASSKRNLMRVSGYFATVFAAGCLAIRYKILPFTEAELLKAVLACHRDHVTFVDGELGASPAPLAIKRTTVQQPFDRLKKFINVNRKGGFVDASAPAAKSSKSGGPIGYVGAHGGRKEYWFADADFEAIAGGKTDARELKVELAAKGLVATERRGKKLSYVVKRPIPGRGRSYVIAIKA
jgi:putative DNA primase/helicase